MPHLPDFSTILTSLPNSRRHSRRNSLSSQDEGFTHSNSRDDIEKAADVLRQDSEEYVMIGRTRVRLADVLTAYGGSLYPGIHAPPEHKFGNPSPLGLSGFAMTTFLLSIINFHGQGVKVPNLVIGLAAFYGGLIQLLAGMWEIATENTFGAVALSSYGGFWMSYAAIFIPWFNIQNSYADIPDQFHKGLGFYLLGWSIFTWMLTLCTFKSTVAFFGMFFLLAVTFLLLAIGEFTTSEGCTTAGGVVGLIVAILSWYNAYAGIATKENSYLPVRPIYMPGAQTEETLHDKIRNRRMRSKNAAVAAAAAAAEEADEKTQIS